MTQCVFELQTTIKELAPNNCRCWISRRHAGAAAPVSPSSGVREGPDAQAAGAECGGHPAALLCGTGASLGECSRSMKRDRPFPHRKSFSATAKWETQ